MSRVFTYLVLCAWALAAIGDVEPAPALPRRSENIESIMEQENTITARKMPVAHFYPFSLWPLPRYYTKEQANDNSNGSYNSRLINTQHRHNQR